MTGKTERDEKEKIERRGNGRKPVSDRGWLRVGQGCG